MNTMKPVDLQRLLELTGRNDRAVQQNHDQRESDMRRIMELAGIKKEADMDDPIIRARMGDTSVSTADIAKAASEPLPPSRFTDTSGNKVASGTPGLYWNERPEAPAAAAAPAPVAATTPVPEPDEPEVKPLPAAEPAVATQPEPPAQVPAGLVTEPPKPAVRREPAGTGAVVGRTRLPGVSATPPAGSLAARKAAEIATRKPDPFGRRVTPTPKPGGFQELNPPAAPYARPRTPVATQPAAARQPAGTQFTSTPGGAATGMIRK